LTITSMLTGEYGISDVCLSIPTVVGHNGITSRLVAPLPESEIASLRHSADCLKEVISQLDFTL
ncbi:MAG: L-lactate dehydrogenase, partial [Treponema sp.]|nr:L-lactate dehydrogenase [Treponema sp.]